MKDKASRDRNGAFMMRLVDVVVDEGVRMTVFTEGILVT